jgi:RNA polymerase sigma factor for flagellar operon FliA
MSLVDTVAEPYAESYSAVSVADEQKYLLAYAPLVKRIVRQLNSQVQGAIGRDDMEQIGLMGLLEALRRYGQPDAAFGSYAGLRVRGAILDELRRQDWRPRAVRQQSHKLRDAVRELTRKLGREPSEQAWTARPTRPTCSMRMRKPSPVSTTSCRTRWPTAAALPARKNS